MSWFRVYSEIKDDPKMLSLSDSEFRLWINLLALASECPERGAIPPYPRRGLAASLHVDELALTAALGTFDSLEMAHFDDDGSVVIDHFLERQYDKPSDYPEATRERKARQRARDNRSPLTSTTEAVTPESRRGHAIDKSREEEIREEEIREDDTKDHVVLACELDMIATREPEPIFFEEGDEPYDLAVELRAQVLSKDPKAKLPHATSKAMRHWSKDFDLLIRVDEREPTEIRAVLDWVKADTFWPRVILSPGSLRKNYTKCLLAMNAPPRASPNGTSRVYQTAGGVNRGNDPGRARKTESLVVNLDDPATWRDGGIPPPSVSALH